MVEIIISTALAGVSVLALSTILVMTTTENEKTRSRANLLNEQALTFDVLNNAIAQTVRIFNCNCGTDSNCLICTDTTGAGCANFPNPSQWQATKTLPNPPAILANGGLCGEDAELIPQIAQQLGIAPATLTGRCLLHTEFEDLADFPRVPSNFNALATTSYPTPQMPNEISFQWAAAPDPNSIRQGSRPADGSCNDYIGAGGNSAYAAGCWKDLYVYYVAPVVETATTDSLPGYVVFAITTAPARNGGKTFADARPLLVSTIGTPSSGATNSATASGIAGLACGYRPSGKVDPTSMLRGGATLNPLMGLALGPTASNGTRTVGTMASGYRGDSVQRSLDFEFFMLAKSRQYWESVSLSTAGTYESWSPAGSNFFSGIFRQLQARVALHNLSEFGIHFLRLRSTRFGLQGLGLDTAKIAGCVGVNQFAPRGTREECCSNAIDSTGKCVPCIPSGAEVAAADTASCCSEQIPQTLSNRICP